ncbi:hypothetical protein [Propionispora sp. 2/2-37]|uniref:hypothetical protein n=1 Tax=Propionispora sp. 2/2-37 TaxID=1677858 RepID=UPI0012E290E5|nr:hypothetical protein [Propionispora sp. 2/2-37]
MNNKQLCCFSVKENNSAAFASFGTGDMLVIATGLFAAFGKILFAVLARQA